VDDRNADRSGSTGAVLPIERWLGITGLRSKRALGSPGQPVV